MHTPGKPYPSDKWVEEERGVKQGESEREGGRTVVDMENEN